MLIRGAAEAADLWQRELARVYAPRRIVLSFGPQANDLPPALGDKPAHDGRTVAYVCRGSTCSAPLDSLGALLSELRAPEERVSSTRP